jgi:hypothetical protein
MYEPLFCDRSPLEPFTCSPAKTAAILLLSYRRQRHRAGSSLISRFCPFGGRLRRTALPNRVEGIG